MMADLMVSEGYLLAGYNYIMLDDCWSSLNRTKDGRYP
jgi:Alpha galactosidase A